ncbi:MAG: hypothetical protein P4L49_20710 [Desulfosporosinus sp.]|nr:hypothetical protein [Desulfosporosinus sp.]
MLFPYGEWVILCLTFVTWVENRASRRFFFLLTITWLIGKSLEVVFPESTLWHWHFARLAVMLVFWVWALRRSERRILPFLFTSFMLSLETLFLVNDPGVIPYGAWLFTGALVLTAWLTAKSYWGTAAAFTGSIMLNQALIRFTNEGLVRHMDFPEAFIWNFGVGLFALGAGLRLGWQYYLARKKLKTTAEHLLPANGVGAYEHPEERELQ